MDPQHFLNQTTDGRIGADAIVADVEVATMALEESESREDTSRVTDPVGYTRPNTKSIEGGGRQGVRRLRTAVPSQLMWAE